jgi:hypothetical protein
LNFGMKAELMHAARASACIVLLALSPSGRFHHIIVHPLPDQWRCRQNTAGLARRLNCHHDDPRFDTPDLPASSSIRLASLLAQRLSLRLGDLPGDLPDTEIGRPTEGVTSLSSSQSESPMAPTAQRSSRRPYCLAQLGHSS